ncbi:MAG: SOS response-associated peptidase family protein [Bacteroidota bacterium]
MIAKYSFNTQYRPESQTQAHLPSLRLLEGGIFTPGQFAPAVVQEYGQYRLKFFKWGLEPAWEAAGTERSKLHIVSANQVSQDQEFQLPLRQHRCLIPADGYYLSNRNRQYKLSHREESAFCFAGIYASQMREDGCMEHHFSLISTGSIGTASQFGLQMPLILPRRLEGVWLDQQSSLPQIHNLLHTQSNLQLAAHPVEELLELNPLDLYPQVAA